MDRSKLTMARQAANAVTTFQTERTGLAPNAVTVVPSNEPLVVTLHEALSPAEILMSKTA